MARRGSDEGALAAALMGLHAALLGIEHAPERLQTIDEAIAVSDRIGAEEVTALALHWRIYDLVELADLAAAKACHARLETLARELHQPLYSHAALAWRAEWAHLAGRLDEAERIQRASLRIAEAAGAPEARGFFVTQLFGLRRDQGRLAELLEPVERLVPRSPGTVGVMWRAAFPLVLLQAGEPERARVAYDSALAAALEDLPTSLFRLTALVEVAEACAALGDAEGAEALIEPPRAARRPARADRVQRLLGLGPALPRAAARHGGPPRRGARPTGGRARAPSRARGPDPRRGHRARSRRCIRRPAGRSVGHPGEPSPSSPDDRGKEACRWWGPRDGVRGPGRDR